MNNRTAPANRRPRHKPGHELTLWDKLSRLTHAQACKLLGEDGDALIRAGGVWEVDIDEQVKLDQHAFRLVLPLVTGGEDITVRLRLQPEGRTNKAGFRPGGRVERLGRASAVGPGVGPGAK